MTRQGLNCTLSYVDGRSAKAYQVRCRRIMHGFEMVADESQGRRHKAYYPHKTAPTEFAIVIELKGRSELNSFNAYLMRYANYILDPAITEVPQMTVKVPSRNFRRIGIPMKGFMFGSQVGEMLWRPTVVFQTSGEPIDWDQTFKISGVAAKAAAKKSPATEFFYPTGTQLSGDQAASGAALNIDTSAFGLPFDPED